MSSAAPWEDEPDDFYMTASGLTVCGHRSHFGCNWCGYVGVPKSHPLYGHRFKDVVPHPAGFMERPLAVDEVGIIGLLHGLATHQTWGEGYAPIRLIFTAHGGLSWSDYISDDPEHWYFGFDCGHAGDLQPGMIAHAFDRDWMLRTNVYRTMKYVQGECLHLAEQLAGYGKEVIDELVRDRSKHD
ncbi:MAG TPA: hypothetical protein VF573_09305 [Paraburkholderia sp.]|uniref:hypothetical protein n=1 Tax=Paraburkholderia sp. TaxID=1926495 RepID=UPI002ED215E0